MPYSKVGPFLQRNTTSVSLKDAPIVKLVDPSVKRVQEVRDECGPHTLIVVRKYYASQPLVDPGSEALRWCRDMEPFMLARLDRNVVYEAGYNEISDKDTGKFAAFSEVCQDFLQSHNRGGVFGNHGVGNLDNESVKPYARLLSRFKDRDFWGWHSYWGVHTTVENPWHTARWAVVDMLRDVPGLVTEWGRDYVKDDNLPKALWGARGWRRGGISESEYMEELSTASALLDRWPNIGGATLFLVGPCWDQWRDFQSEEIYRRIRAEQTRGTPYFYVNIANPVKPPAAPGDSNTKPPISADLLELMQVVERRLSDTEEQLRVLRKAIENLKERIDASE